MNNIRAVLFDFDGTLTLPGSIDFAGIKQALDCPGDVPILEFIGRKKAGKPRREAWHILQRFEDQAAERSRPNEGAENLIRFLKRRRLRRGILTRNSRASIATALKNFARVRLTDFNVIITRDHVERPKPDPEGVLLAARRLRVPPANLLVVGDYVYDIEAGQRAGAPTVFLESNLTTRRPEPPADFSICTLREVKAIIIEAQKGKGAGRKDTSGCCRWALGSRHRDVGGHQQIASRVVTVGSWVAAGVPAGRVSNS